MPRCDACHRNGVVHVDCQRSAINAFRKTFGCTVRLCLFHVNQALWMAVVKNDLAKEQRRLKATASCVAAKADVVSVSQARPDAGLLFGVV